MIAMPVMRVASRINAISRGLLITRIASRIGSRFLISTPDAGGLQFGMNASSREIGRPTDLLWWLARAPRVAGRRLRPEPPDETACRRAAIPGEPRAAAARIRRAPAPHPPPSSSPPRRRDADPGRTCAARAARSAARGTASSASAGRRDRDRPRLDDAGQVEELIAPRNCRA